MQVPCGGCGTTIDIQAGLRQPQTFNMETVSMLVFEHPEKVKCPSCDALLILAIHQITGLQLVAIPFNPEPSKIVKPGNGRKIILPPN